MVTLTFIQADRFFNGTLRMEEAANLPHPSERVDRMTQLRNEFQKAETYKYGYFMQASKLQILRTACFPESIRSRGSLANFFCEAKSVSKQDVLTITMLTCSSMVLNRNQVGCFPYKHEVVKLRVATTF